MPLFWWRKSSAYACIYICMYIQRDSLLCWEGVSTDLPALTLGYLLWGRWSNGDAETSTSTTWAGSGPAAVPSHWLLCLDPAWSIHHVWDSQCVVAWGLCSSFCRYTPCRSRGCFSVKQPELTGSPLIWLALQFKNIWSGMRSSRPETVKWERETKGDQAETF